MIEVFRTNVETNTAATLLLQLLEQEYPGFKINFDLHDPDKILRIEGEAIPVAGIVRLLRKHGYECVLLL